MAEIDQKYNKNPAGWNISVGRDKKGYGNIHITNPVDVWQIKIDSLYKPNPYGLGMKLGKTENFPDLINLKNNPSFGFRPLLPSHLEKLQQNFDQQQPINSVIDEILNTKPVSLDQLGKSNFLMGPILRSSFQGYVSDKQKELDRKLGRSLDNLLLSKGIGYDYI